MEAQSYYGIDFRLYFKRAAGRGWWYIVIILKNTVSAKNTNYKSYILYFSTELNIRNNNVMITYDYEIKTVSLLIKIIFYDFLKIVD